MGLGRKVGAFLGLVPEDAARYADTDEYDQSYEGGYAEPAYDEPYTRPAEPRPLRPYPADPNAVTHGALAFKAVNSEPASRREPESVPNARPATVKLNGFAEARVIGEKYREGGSVILDMTEMSDGDARRLVDFSAGLAFSLHGSIEKVAPKVFMLLPPNFDMAGSGGSILADARAYAGR